MGYRWFVGRIGTAAVLVGLTLVTTSSSLRAQDAAAPSGEAEEKARAHFRLGRAYYDNGDFAQAAVEFEAAYQISQRSALLYNIYLAYRDANDTRHAAEALRKYLLLEKKVENRGQLESRLAALERSLADGTAPTPSPAAAKPQPAAAAPASLEPQSAQPTAAQPSAAAATEPDAPAAATEAAAAEHADGGSNTLLPIVLMGAGGAMLVGSVVTGIMTLGKKGDLQDAADACKKAGNCSSLSPSRVADLEAAVSSGKTLALVTDVLLFGGLAVAGTGAVLFLLNQGGTEKAPSTTASLACAHTGCVGTLRGQF